MTAVCICFILANFLVMVNSRSVNVSWRENVNIAKGFPCIPRPRSISVLELFKDEIEPGESVTPVHAILHRFVIFHMYDLSCKNNL